MSKTDLARAVRGIVAGGTVVVLMSALSACGGAGGETTQAPTAPQATVAVQPTSAPAAPAATAPSSPASAGGDQLAAGKLIFEKTAGGVGCAYCHGLDGKGNGPAGVGAPANRGKTEEQVRNALASVELMGIVKLSDGDVKAVAAYLQYLNQQP